LAFQQRVAGGFLALAARGPDPWLVVDATDPVEMVAAMVWEAVEVLAGQGGPP
jgi:thymidylate kinase